MRKLLFAIVATSIIVLAACTGGRAGAPAPTQPTVAPAATQAPAAPTAKPSGSTPPPATATNTAVPATATAAPPPPAATPCPPGLVVVNNQCVPTTPETVVPPAPTVAPPAATAPPPAATPSAPKAADTPRPTTPPPAAVSCQTDSDVMAMFGFPAGEIVRTDAPWDGCKWNRQNVPSTMSFVLREGWGLTYTDVRGNVWVTVGRGQEVMVRGFTLRQPGQQILQRGPQGLLDFEWSYGFAPERGTATFPSCPDENFIGATTPTPDQKTKCAAQGTKPVTTGSPSAPAPGPAAKPTAQLMSCFANGSEVAAVVGGKPDKWTLPDKDFPGTWKYLDRGNKVDMRHPGDPIGDLDVWVGGPKTVNTRSNIPEKQDEATAKCRPGSLTKPVA